MKKENILFVIDNFEYGGGASFVQGYTRYLNSKGVSTTVLGEWGEAASSKDYFKGTELVSFPRDYLETVHTRNIFYTLIYRVKYFYLVNKLFNAQLKKKNFVAVHLNLIWSSAALLLFNPRIYSLPRITTFYGDRELEIESSIRNIKRGYLINIKLIGIRIIQKITLLLSSKVISFSKYSTHLLIERFGVKKTKIVQIPGAIFKDDYKNVLTKKSFNRNDNCHLLNISRFETRKGQELLLRALKILVNNGFKVRLTLCGPMKYGIQEIMYEYENLGLREKVVFLHSYHGKDKLELMKSADLFIIPSQELETFGMTIIESMGCGTPVVGTPVGAIPEILSKLDSKLISKSVSAKSLANSIKYYCHLSYKNKIKLSRKAREIAFRYYDAEKVLKKLEKIYIEN